MGDYRPQEIEAKWQKRWEEKRVFESEAEIQPTTEPESSGAEARSSEGPMSELKLRPPGEKAQDPPLQTKGAVPSGEPQDPGANAAPGAPSGKIKAVKK